MLGVFDGLPPLERRCGGTNPFRPTHLNRFDDLVAMLSRVRHREFVDDLLHGPPDAPTCLDRHPIGGHEAAIGEMRCRSWKGACRRVDVTFAFCCIHLSNMTARDEPKLKSCWALPECAAANDRDWDASRVAEAGMMVPDGGNRCLE